MTEKTIETKNCKSCGIKFSITDKDMEFYNMISPVYGEKKFQIPAPSMCPKCRQQKRLSFRNERKLYKRNCDATGKAMIAVQSPNKPYTVYSYDAWRSDNWDPLDYGIDFDFNRPFFEQFEELIKKVPLINLFASKNENSQFVNFAGHNKDCYLIFDSDFCEKCFYSNVVKHSTYLVDCSFCLESELLYECVDCEKSFNLKYCIDCEECANSYFIKNCSNCKDCFLCGNLVNKQYCIRNKQYSKEEYYETIKSILENYSFYDLNNEFKEIIKKMIVKSIKGTNTENCSGNNINDSKNVLDSYDIGECEDCKYLDIMYKTKSSYDVSSFGENVEKAYNSGTIGVDSYNILYSFSILYGSNLTYCYAVRNAKDCFGCVSLHNNNQYCILNKEYSKQEYETLVPKIIEHMQSTGEWGEHFPQEISPFGYNETVAMDYFHLEKEKALEQGFKWMGEEYPLNIPEGIETIQSKDLPKNINEIDDTILSKAIICDKTGKPYRINKMELEFYRRQNLPLPIVHPDQRHTDRMKLRNPRKLRDRNCAKCGIEIKTSYAPERTEVVYCERCYNEEIY